jgi:outer membrane biogenesis lipoprotein LolB
MMNQKNRNFAFLAAAAALLLAACANQMEPAKQAIANIERDLRCP